MNTNIEIEFKTFITKDKYEELMQKFNSDNNTLIQINHYFDTVDSLFQKEKKVLRIRQKKDQYKLTKKSKGDGCNIENHLFLTKDEALNMISNGFNANIIGENVNVINVGSLKTYRFKFQYKSGFIFLDKSEYNGITDYEIEFESSDNEIGKKDFLEFLNEYNIPYNKSYSKFKRCMETIKK